MRVVMIVSKRVPHVANKLPLSLLYLPWSAISSTCAQAVTLALRLNLVRWDQANDLDECDQEHKN
jgi:hypothetical protein